MPKRNGAVAEAEKVMPKRFDRFHGLAPWKQIAATTVNVIGCGGIGSWTVLALACLGVRVRAFDPDQTEAHNFGGQPLSRIGKPKVEQLQKMTKGLGDIEAFVEPFSLERAAETPADIWLSGVDSVDSRLQIWEILQSELKRTGKPDWYVDGRMGGTTSQTYSFNPSDAELVKRYEASLAPKNGFDDDPCAMRSTVFAGMGCATHLVSEVARKLSGKTTPRLLNMEWLSGDLIVMERF